MNKHYYTLFSAINTYREILRQILSQKNYEMENEKLEEASEWLEELAIKDHCNE